MGLALGQDTLYLAPESFVIKIEEKRMQRKTVAFILLVILAIIGSFPTIAPAQAQSGDALNCQAVYMAAESAVLANCAAMSLGTVCAASGSVTVETTDGQTVSATGSAVPLVMAKTIQVGPGDGTAWNLALIYLPISNTSRDYVTLVVVGPAVLDIQTVNKYLPGAAFTLSSEAQPSPCGDLARPGVMVQSLDKILTMLNVNGVDLAINGSVVLQGSGGNLTVNALSHETILSKTGSVIFAGYAQTIAPDGSAAPPAPYVMADVANLPIEIMPHMERIPLPGNAVPAEDLPLHRHPDPATYTNDVAEAGLPLNVLGQNPAGDWLYIVTYEGLTGWVPAMWIGWVPPDGLVMPSFEDAPPAPVRPYGPVQGQGITTYETNNIRSGPGEDYDIVVRLPLNTKIDIYARSPDNQWYLIGLQDGSRAWISVSIVQALTEFTITDMPYSPDYLPQ